MPLVKSVAIVKHAIDTLYEDQHTYHARENGTKFKGHRKQFVMEQRSRNIENNLR